MRCNFYDRYFDTDSWRRRRRRMSVCLALLPVALATMGMATALSAGAQISIGPPISIGGGPLPPPAPGHAQVLTYHNDNQRTGVNPLEGPDAADPTHKPLTPANIKTGFGKLWTHSVDGAIYGQPLFVSDQVIRNIYSGRGIVHKGVVYVTTANNSIYAFDADSATGANSSPLWFVNFNFIAQNITPVPGDAVTDLFGNPQTDIQPVIGIIGTPVINPTNSTMYVLVRTQEYGFFIHRLHAIDISTGQEQPGSPVNVYNDLTGDAPFYPGTGDDTDGSNVYLDPLYNNQRAALTLSPDNKTLYIAYDGTDYLAPYHGWVLAYSTSNLYLTQTFCTTPNAAYSYIPGDPPVGGGVGMSGSGLALDAAGNIYAGTGLGAFDANAPTGSDNTAYGESILRLNPANLTVKDYFTPFNWVDLNATGADLGSGGLVVLPDSAGVPGHPHLLAAAGNEGKFYLLDRDNLGKIGNGNDNAALYTRRNSLGQQYGPPAYFNGQLFYHSAGDVLRVFQLNQAYPYVTDVTPTGTASPAYDFPGAIPSISSNGASSGVLWEIEPYAQPNPTPTDPNQTLPPVASLRAYDVTAPGAPLWSARDKGGSDIGPPYVKYSVPTVANGKVYVGGDGLLVAYGLVSTTAPASGIQYVISGPANFAAISPAAVLETIECIPLLTANVRYDFSITAVGLDGKPIKVSRRVRLYLQNGNLITPVGNATFNNSSITTFSTFFQFGGNLTVADDIGATSSVPITVGGQSSFGFDHYVVHTPRSLRSGQVAQIFITGETALGAPAPLPLDALAVYDTLPTATQPYGNPAGAGLLPGDQDGFLDPANPPAATSTVGYQYEFQWGFGNFTTLGFPPPDPAYYQPDPTPAGSPAMGILVRLNGAGPHVIIVTSGGGAGATSVFNIFGSTATAIVNVF